jgi:hypothetical protein
MKVHAPRTKKKTTPSPRLAGRGLGRGDLNLTHHLTPALSPNFVGGEGGNIAAVLVFIHSNSQHYSICACAAGRMRETS